MEFMKDLKGTLPVMNFEQPIKFLDNDFNAVF